MVQSSSFIIELLEKIGVPFVGAVEAVSIENKMEDAEAAKLMAQLLAQAVQASISVSENLTMPEDVVEADNVRLALTTLTGSIMADFHRQHKRMPEAADMERIVKPLQAVLPFAENFSGASTQASRLSLLGKDTILFDELQVGLVIAQIMTPVMSAITEFPFGQAEAKLLQDVVTKLQTYAADYAKLSGDGSKLGEMIALKAMASIYADCHRAETERLSHADDAARANLSLDSVWRLFDKRIAMFELVAGMSDSTRTKLASTSASDSVTPEKASEVTSLQAATPDVAVTSATVEAVATPSPTTPPPAASPVSEPPPTQATTPPAGGNPMGFFSAKKDEQGVQTPQEPPPSTTQTPAQPATQEAATSPAPVTPPTEAPPPAVPVETAAPPVENSSSDAPANPMGFFKPGAKKEE